MSKDFKSPKVNVTPPELNFISQETIEAVDGKQAKGITPKGKGKKTTKQAGSNRAPEGYKSNPAYIELKSKRVQLVLQPSLYERVKKAADKEGISFNEYCHRLLEGATGEV